MASTIGIKIANGEFYSIVEENSPVKKRLVLTTVHDNQRSVQIDLYKSYTHTMADALYIGSLVVENIKPRSKGEPSIEMVIASTPKGDITASAVDLDSSVQGEHHTLNVSLKSLDEDNREYEIPDFELESNEAPPPGLFEKAAEAREEEKQKFPWLVVVCAALVLVALGLAAWLFFFRGRGASPSSSAAAPRPAAQAVQTPPSSPPVQAPPASQPASPASSSPVQPRPAETQPAQSAPSPPAQSTPSQPARTQPVPPQTPVIQAPPRAPAATAAARRERPAPPVASYKVPSVIPREGAPYRIRWGDTLWDISEAFYRNPWLYPRIARFNNIRNPDLIISGTTIRVPPRN